ncbi:MAG: SDR family NAD(P)-dependent oxidoreductase [Bacteriovoracaceae bacterium]|jgi:uncharacterized protein|nr:SDR family NAD(P)-dependent oxidoreductase [Bacteriovoracaceae bacterium]
MTNKVLISGIFGGIGREMCKNFTQRGIKVVGIDLHKALDHDLDLHDFFKIDLSKKEALNERFEEIYSKHSDIDLVINNAGVAHLQPFLDETEEEFNQVMDINFNSLVYSTRFWVKRFHDHINCGIANMASMAGHVSPSGICSYSASKHAVVGFTESLRLELKALDIPIKIYLITPGFINTNIMKIGEVGGPPESFSKLTSTPEKAGIAIVQSILKGQETIIPDSGGKILKQMNRWAPDILNMGNSFIAKRILKK